MQITPTLSAEQVAQLDELAESEQISRAEAVRRAIAQLLERSPPALVGFGLWASGAPVAPERDGLALEQSLRNEWLTR